MSEEVENPRRNIMLATVFTCLVIGILSAIEVYVAQLAWPAHTPFPESMVDTAFVHVAERVGGKFLFQLLNATLLIANMGSGMAAQFGASRLLYGMGRDNALPKRFFGAVDPATAFPATTFCSRRAARWLASSCSPTNRARSCLNFGAFIAFMGVNAAALVHYKFRSQEKVLPACADPASRHGGLRLHLAEPEPRRATAGCLLDHRWTHALFRDAPQVARSDVGFRLRVAPANDLTGSSTQANIYPCHR